MRGLLLADRYSRPELTKAADGAELIADRNGD